MAEARITEFFGETQTDGRSVRISRGSLGFHGIGIVHAKGSLEVALPPTSSKEFCRRPDCRELSTTSTSAGAKVQGINMMKEKLLDSYDG